MTLQNMTRKELRNYLKNHPEDHSAWEILFKKVNEAPKTMVSTPNEIDQFLKERT